MDRSAGHSTLACQATLPLGLWHLAVHVEAPRCSIPSTLWHAWLHCYAQCMDLSNFVSLDLTGDGFNARLHADFGRTGPVATAKRLLLYEFAAGTFLLRTISRH